MYIQYLIAKRKATQSMLFVIFQFIIYNVLKYSKLKENHKGQLQYLKISH